jgi:AraC-like DNA-binding protein
VNEVVCRIPSTSAAAGYRLFSTADPVHAHDYICNAYGSATMRMIGDQTSLRMRDEQHDLGWLTMSDFRHTAGLEQIVEPLDRLMVARVVTGRWRRDTIGEAVQNEQGDVCIVAQPDRPCLIRWDSPVHMQFISIDPSVLLDAAAAPGDLVPRFTNLTPASAGSKQLVAEVMEHLVTDVVANPAARTSPLALRGAARTLAAALLEAFPNNAMRDPIVRDRTDGVRSRVVRAAIGYVHDHAHEDITISDLAAAAGVSRQAVHLAFRQHLQSTPSCYLERVRLDRVHRDLTDLDPQWTTVEQVALLWGFTRLERFRRYYSHTYGTSPEHTLHG